MYSKIAQLLAPIRNILGREQRNNSASAPNVADLPSEEQEFLKLLRPMGLNWITTRREFEIRYGVRNVHEFLKIVELPPTTVFTKEPLTFHFNHEPHLSDLPPEYLSAHFNVHQDARKNFMNVESQLCTLLGEGERKDAPGCLQRSWRVGIFEVGLKAWPSETQPHYFKDSSVTYLRYPELLEAATISVSSEIVHIFPFKQLEWIVDLITKHEVSDERKILKLPSNYAPFDLRFDMRRSRRNPDSLQKVLEDDSIIAWKTEVPGKIGVTYRKCSLVFDVKSDGGLILTRILPARGPGGSELTVEEATVTSATPAWVLRQIILCDDEQSGLDERAQQLASFWNLTLRYEQCDAD